MFYRVGERKDGWIEWGSEDPPKKHYYGSGAYPQVSINNDNVVIEVRKGQFLDRCYYRLGSINADKMMITWGTSIFFNSGVYPNIALNNTNTVMALFQNNILTKQLCYRIGRLSKSKSGIVWDKKKQETGILAEAFSVDINDSGIVVVSFETPITNHIHYRVGVVVAGEGVVEWCQSIHRSVGFTPSVSINNESQVIMIHQSRMNRHLVSNVGVAKWSDEFKGIIWSSENNSLNRHYAKGLYPSVALNNDGKVVEVHEPRFAPNRNRLYYYAGEIKHE
jgi:hypothetical protein